MVATAQPDKLWDPIAARWARTRRGDPQQGEARRVARRARHFYSSSRQEGALSEALPATSSSNRARRFPTHHKSDDV